MLCLLCAFILFLQCWSCPLLDQRVRGGRQACVYKEEKFDCTPIFNDVFYLSNFYKGDHGDDKCNEFQLLLHCDALEGMHEQCKDPSDTCTRHLCSKEQSEVTQSCIHLREDLRKHYIEVGLRNNWPMHPGPRVVKILLMHRDQWPILKYWVLWHAHIYGLHNLYVVDGSHEPEPIQFLRNMKLLGLNVIRSTTDLNHLEGEVITILKMLKWSADYVIKLDTDEFLTYFVNGSAPSLDRREILQGLEDNDMRGRWGQVPYAYNSVPNADGSCWPFPMRFWNESDFHKAISPAPTFEWGQLGFHEAKTNNGYDGGPHGVRTNFGMFHFHHFCYDFMVEAARTVLISHQYMTGQEPHDELLNKLRSKQPNMDTCMFYSCHKVFEYWHHLEDKEKNKERFRKAAHMDDPDLIHFRQFADLVKDLEKQCSNVTKIF